METQSKNLAFEQILDDGVNVNTMGLIPIPLESANSSEIRRFVVNVLEGQYDIDREHAQKIAQLWTVGSGRELRQFPAGLFIQLFGQQAGWVLYKEVSARVIAENVNTMDIFNHKKRGMAFSFHSSSSFRNAYHQLRFIRGATADEICCRVGDGCTFHFRLSLSGVVGVLRAHQASGGAAFCHWNTRLPLIRSCWKR